MANVNLKNGISPTFSPGADDVVSSNGDNQFYNYYLDTNDGNDKINLSGAFATSYYSIVTGAGNDTITAGRGAFYDGSGNDVYHARGDVLFFAGAGNDTYDGGSFGEANGIVFDTINFSYAPTDSTVGALNTQNMRIDLAITTAQNFGIYGMDKLISIENALGGEGNDIIRGNASKNQLDGNGGNDLLYGFGANDFFVPGNGADIMIGGYGGDSFYFNGDPFSRDTARYTSKWDSGIWSSNPAAPRVWDIISGFDKGGTATDDLIDLERIDTSTAAGDQDFIFRGGQGFTSTAAWEVRLRSVKESPYAPGFSTLVEIDTDSDINPEMTILVSLVTGLKASDFDL
jgi:Ca2+-binding RTX toxin-like protein